MPDVPHCAACGGPRVFELQLMPPLIQLTIEAAHLMRDIGGQVETEEVCRAVWHAAVHDSAARPPSPRWQAGAHKECMHSVRKVMQRQQLQAVMNN